MTTPPPGYQEYMAQKQGYPAPSKPRAETAISFLKWAIIAMIATAICGGALIIILGAKTFATEFVSLVSGMGISAVMFTAGLMKGD